MPYGAQKDKEFPRLLCPCNNLLLFRAQRNRQVPHGSTPHRGRGTVLFHLSEHRCPSLSTLAGPLSKQLVNVLGRLLDTQPLRQRLGQQGASWVRQQHPWEKTTSVYTAIYANALKGKRAV